ncbi:hypothetical protein BDV93DRAFT_560076 [Ceratobasidium sp. AG-I]|nr:hypothetical protein BDV93DRAFT_560076 [Ceratobasidium sp. AG-I]
MTTQGVRDPNYYFEDGSVVFLVEEYLFKIQCSIITSKSEVFRDMFGLPIQAKSSKPNLSSSLEGSCDENPIVIPQVKARQFRNLLLFFYGVMTDPEYLSLVSDTTDEVQHSPTVFTCYLDVASLANRFCMTDIEKWAHKQLTRVLLSSRYLSFMVWDHNSLLEALWYSKLTPDRELEHNVRNLIECYVIFSPIELVNAWRAPSIAHLYKDPTLKQQDPALFGHIFCAVLSTGHRSSFWKDRLTRDDRSILFAAQAYLTPLPTTLPIDWITDVTKVTSTVDAAERSSCFHGCSQQFSRSFASHFNCRTELTRDSPLVGVTALSSLATRRQSVVESLKLLKPDCKCTSQLILALDVKMDALFAELAEKYHGCLDQ